MIKQILPLRLDPALRSKITDRATIEEKTEADLILKAVEEYLERPVAYASERHNSVEDFEILGEK